LPKGEEQKISVKGSILRRIAAGEQSAVQDCLSAYGGLVWSLARRLSPNQEDAEDAVQEIFIDVWKSAARYDEAFASEVAFVAMIARRRLIDRLRRRERQPQVSYLDDLTTEPGARTDRQTEICAEAALAARALNQLRPEQQKVIHLAVYQGLSHQEIAQATGMPLGTVKTHVRRGLIQIREALGVNVERVKEASL
jgi:RNA polymerase sigma-70 factor (ECF subfamily)